MDNPKEFRCLSLFTGYAGIELGLRRVIRNLRTVAYVEVEAFACANLVAKIETGFLDVAPVWTDIKTFDGRPFRKRVHIITAGYPCQGESCASKRKGKADPRWLWPHIERIIETVEPLWFFGENVSGHLSLGFPTVYRSLRNMGYKVEARLVRADEPDIGAPHKRERLFILAKSRAYGRGGWTDGTSQRLRRSLQTQRPSDLADTEHPEQGQGTIKETPTGIGRDRLTECSLAESEQKGLQGAIQNIEAQGWEDEGGFIAGCRWPARPGQPQYEWEEPRVVMSKTDCKFLKGYVEKYKTALTRKQAKDLAYALDCYGIEPLMGKSTYGITKRTDQLRLLGNGVVPQQAEKAFRELIGLF
ncbi:MAG: DNA cytosine methyltransferase [Desulfobacterales bacterium]|nr:DNA cytosine methyltransferase [Desulfobacterales bacterium]